MSAENSKKVLLIDDDPIQFQLTQSGFRKFQDKGYKVEWAATYEEGLNRLLKETFAVCLLDYKLRDRDGLELLRVAKGEGCHTPIVFLTAESEPGVDIAALEAGALDYLVKGEMTPRMLERSLRYAVKLGGTLEELRRLATRDQLTGLLNRREFDRILAEESERARRFERPVSLVLFDIDHFKKVNDKHGHQVGDEVLRGVARRLDDLVRSVDRLTRIGGEEFALILMETDGPAALKCAERFCAAVRKEPVEIASGTLAATVSAGSASMPADAEDVRGLIAAADKALYAAKAGGRDRAIAFAGL